MKHIPMMESFPPEVQLPASVFGAMCLCVGFGIGFTLAATDRCLLCAAFRVGRWMRG